MTLSLEDRLEAIRRDFETAGLKPGPVKKVLWSGRMSRSRGTCRKEKDGFVIRISDKIRDYPDLVRETLAHELLHTVDGCFGHGAAFRSRARRLVPFGYSITATYEPEAFEIRGRYRFECRRCGTIVCRSRQSAFTKHPERYLHKGCGGTFRVCGKS